MPEEVYTSDVKTDGKQVMLHLKDNSYHKYKLQFHIRYWGILFFSKDVSFIFLNIITISGLILLKTLMAQQEWLSKRMVMSSDWNMAIALVIVKMSQKCLIGILFQN